MTHTNEHSEWEEIVKELRMVSNMINMGEKIQWGRETTLMDKAANVIETITTLLQKEREAAYGHAEIVRQRDIQAILADLKNSGDLSAKDAARIAEEYNIQL